MDDFDTDPLDDCGCCAGSDRLPGARYNAPGQASIQYRIGKHGQFKASMLARLSSADNPALAGLRTRANDDFSIAWCDASAMMLDVLGFYQERIANEAYLRTSVERRSVAELARLIGYQPSPGVAASTHLAFSLEEAPGARALAAKPVTIPAGVRVQSIPGADEEPQTFETVEPAIARVEWNAIPAQMTEPQVFVYGTRELFVAGVATQVQVGDVILIVGDERLLTPSSDRWDARVVTGVETDNSRDITRITWAEALGHGTVNPAEIGVRAFVFRLRTSLFGHGAADARMLRPGFTAEGLMTGAGATLAWANYAIQNNEIDLDGAFAKVLPESWVLLAGGRNATGTASLPGQVALFRAKVVQQRSRAAFGLSGKVTRITPYDTTNLADFDLNTTLALAQSEELTMVPRPLSYPVYGPALALGRRDDNLVRGQMLAISGKRQRLRILADDAAIVFKPDGEPAVATKPGDSFVLTAAPTWLLFGSEIALPPETLDFVLRWKPFFALRWRVMDRDGRLGTLDAVPPVVRLQAASKDDPVVSELVRIGSAAGAVALTRDRAVLDLASPLANIYDRATVAACANLLLATHGETVGEVGGSGDASVGGQRFMLKQAPQTHVSAATPNGRKATLEVRIDGQRWTEVPSLFERAPDEHVYALRQDDEQRTIVQFGDGSEGARLPSASDNLRFRYRKGLGQAGNVRAGQLTTLLGRPLGVKTVTNPVDASGGQDREDREQARRNAPLTTLTLGRAVSLQDYTDFARGFAGIAKAEAAWLRIDGHNGIFISLAGPDGAAVAATDNTFMRLSAALRSYGDALVPLRLASYRPVTFRIKAKLKIAATAEDEVVLRQADQVLRQHFSFANRDFSQATSIDEVMAVLQAVPGVEAVDVDQLFRLDPGAIPTLRPRLFTLPPTVQPDGSVSAAEVLTLEPGPVALQVMP